MTDIRAPTHPPDSIQPRSNESAKTRKGLSGPWLTVARLLSLAAVVGITLYIFSIRDRAAQLAVYGYPGIFLLSVLANATLFLPAPGVAFVFSMGAVFPPLPVALAAGAGSALGELSGYLAGFSGRAVLERSPRVERLEQLMRRYGALTILVLAFIPNPVFDVAGITAGILRMPVQKFLFYCWIGKTLKMLAFAFAGAYAVQWLTP
jgi:membrane protein DedA with SNARE-associated domain